MNAAPYAARSIELDHWEECVGPLHSVEEQEGRLYLVIGKYEVVMPTGILDTSRLRSLIGRRIGVLHTDLEDKPYLMRVEEDGR